VAAASGIEADAAGTPPAEDGFGHELDDSDEGEDDLAAEAPEERAAEPAAPPASHAPEPQPEPESPRPFSLFSWIRREPHPPQESQAHAPGEERKPERG
jgi:hypothetical protein